MSKMSENIQCANKNSVRGRESDETREEMKERESANALDSK